MNDQWPAHIEELKRLRKIEGQIRGVQKMIEDKRYCIDILTQNSSVVGAIMEVENNILNRHLRSCAYGTLKKGNGEEKDRGNHRNLEKVQEILKRKNEVICDG